MAQRRFCAEGTGISCAPIGSSRIAPRPPCSVAPEHWDDAGCTETTDNEQLAQRASISSAHVNEVREARLKTKSMGYLVFAWCPGKDWAPTQKSPAKSTTYSFRGNACVPPLRFIGKCRASSPIDRRLTRHLTTPFFYKRRCAAHEECKKQSKTKQYIPHSFPGLSEGTRFVLKIILSKSKRF